VIVLMAEFRLQSTNSNNLLSE